VRLTLAKPDAERVMALPEDLENVPGIATMVQMICQTWS
jgi:hypothetical protein